MPPLKAVFSFTLTNSRLPQFLYFCHKGCGYEIVTFIGDVDWFGNRKAGR
jgi:hypothetical protein